MFKWIGRHAWCVGLFAIFGVATLAEPSFAQSATMNWPQRPVRLILPYGPGSATDIAARLITDELAKRWGKPIVVENKPGGDNLIAISAFLNAKDDHALFFSSSAAFLAHRYVHKKLDYNFERDFAPIAKIADTIPVIAVPASLKIESIKKFVELAKATPEAFNLAGATGISEFAIDAFLKEQNLKSVRVPYKDFVGAVRDLGEARIHFLLTSYPTVRPLVETGKVRIIAAGNRGQIPVLKEISSIPESGYPLLAVETSVAMFGRTDTPIALRRKIADDVKAILADSAISGRISATGQNVEAQGPDELADVLKQQFQYVDSIARVLGISKAEN